MSKVPSLSYQEIIAALKRDNWKFVRQKGSHIRLEKILDHETLKITVPAHRPVKRSTLSHILKQARISVEDVLKLL
jgi:predicted RNA binding protein YcfA (HicA-like mRNA interferase family)